eukprot:TRINITY_DN17152_c0_g1_i1.p1 TRINITY_DN17152_c0_g1~~TRINITY_DN17152_c0_g1_i1.p1  ORF type:complete len:227 (+),score=20.81 TRINITY_DN17152_c0_g1_i1:41-721(+)
MDEKGETKDDKKQQKSKTSSVLQAEEMFSQVVNILATETNQVKREREQLEKEKEIMKGILKFQKGMIKLNVGGLKFATSIETLRKYPTSMIGVMFSGNFEMIQNSDGSFFIDRDGTHFRYILNHLRGCELQLPNDKKRLEELRQEAHFYQLIELEEMIKNSETCRVCQMKKSQGNCSAHKVNNLTCSCYSSIVPYGCGVCQSHKCKQQYQCCGVCVDCKRGCAPHS